MTRLKTHMLLGAGLPHPDIAARVGLSTRTVDRIVKEEEPTAADLAAGKMQSGKRRGRPPMIAVHEAAVRSLLEAEPRLPGTEVLRRMRKSGYAGGRSAMLALVARVRPPEAREPLVPFEGLPGEFTQFDFGEGYVTFEDGSRQKVQFFAARLKYSRYMHVLLVPDQRSEALVRAVVACLLTFGGSTKQWVFDNPKTIRISKVGEPLVLHAHLRDLVAEMNVLPEMCAPHAGNQKGYASHCTSSVTFGAVLDLMAFGPRFFHLCLAGGPDVGNS
jgi:transposase